MARFFDLAHHQLNPASASHAPEQAEVDVNPAMATLASSCRVILLQGPVGSFFDRLTVWLKARGAKVDRVVFQAGDLRDCNECAPLKYTDTLAAWPDFFSALVDELNADCVVLFGQARGYHASAIAIAKQRGVPVVVLEEGYIRPGYITMELGGVNGYSSTLNRYVWRAPARQDDIQLLPPSITLG